MPYLLPKGAKGCRWICSNNGIVAVQQNSLHPASDSIENLRQSALGGGGKVLSLEDEDLVRNGWVWPAPFCLQRNAAAACAAPTQPSSQPNHKG